LPTRTGADPHGCATALCTTDGYRCPAGFSCSSGAGGDAHGCLPISCANGFKCSPNYDCDKASQALHNCVQRTCAADRDCDCGACVQGSCADRLFVCSPPPPP
jgi:hypothetical protein